MPQISAEEIKILGKYIFNLTGIMVGQDKGYLLETRLQPLLREYGCASYAELYHKANTAKSKELPEKIVDAISTNETYFFRDNTPFDLLRNKIIPDIIDQRRRQSPKAATIPLRIWSAACSSGQEAYSIGITLLEMGLGRPPYEISILGTDISNNIIAQASYGKYNQFEVERGLSSQLRGKYFTQVAGGWRIRDEVRVLANFYQLNLLKPFPASLPRFDVIFCRNVAIYFNAEDKSRLFRKIARILAPGGALILGGSETLTDKSANLEARHYLRGIFYQVKEQPGAASDVVPAAARAVAPPKPVAPVPPRPAPRSAAIDARFMKGAGVPSPAPAVGPPPQPEVKKPLPPPPLSPAPSKPAAGMAPPELVTADKEAVESVGGEKKKLLASLTKSRQVKDEAVSPVKREDSRPRSSLLAAIQARKGKDDDKD